MFYMIGLVLKQKYFEIGCLFNKQNTKANTKNDLNNKVRVKRLVLLVKLSWGVVSLGTSLYPHALNGPYIVQGLSGVFLKSGSNNTTYGLHLLGVTIFMFDLTVFWTLTTYFNPFSILVVKTKTIPCWYFPKNIFLRRWNKLGGS